MWLMGIASDPRVHARTNWPRSAKSRSRRRRGSQRGASTVKIVRTSIARPACFETGPCVWGSLAQPWFVAFDLADGSRLAVELLCEGPVSDQPGRVIQPASCSPQTSQATERGREPSA